LILLAGTEGGGEPWSKGPWKRGHSANRGGGKNHPRMPIEKKEGKAVDLEERRKEIEHRVKGKTLLGGEKKKKKKNADGVCQRKRTAAVARESLHKVKGKHGVRPQKETR